MSSASPISRIAGVGFLGGARRLSHSSPSSSSPPIFGGADRGRGGSQTEGTQALRHEGTKESFLILPPNLNATPIARMMSADGERGAKSASGGRAGEMSERSKLEVRSWKFDVRSAIDDRTADER